MQRSPSSLAFGLLFFKNPRTNVAEKKNKNSAELQTATHYGKKTREQKPPREVQGGQGKSDSTKSGRAHVICADPGAQRRQRDEKEKKHAERPCTARQAGSTLWRWSQGLVGRGQSSWLANGVSEQGHTHAHRDTQKGEKLKSENKITSDYFPFLCIC